MDRGTYEEHVEMDSFRSSNHYSALLGLACFNMVLVYGCCQKHTQIFLESRRMVGGTGEKEKGENMENTGKKALVEIDGWCYALPQRSGNKLVTLIDQTIRWVSIRFWNTEELRWYTLNGEPEFKQVIGWRDLPQEASGYYIRGELIVHGQERKHGV